MSLKPEQFTKRELNLMKYLCLTKEEIAEKLLISPLTVASHIEHIRNKVGVRTRASLIIELLKAKILKLNEVITDCGEQKP